MNKNKIILILLVIFVIILEILPDGAVLRFAEASDNGDIVINRVTESYFSLLPFGYANVGPLLTALLTCILLIMALYNLFTDKGKKAINNISIAALICSLLPVFYGFDFLSIVGVLISLVFVAILTITSLNVKHSQEHQKIT